LSTTGIASRRKILKILGKNVLAGKFGGHTDVVLKKSGRKPVEKNIL
jgi:hypothetical protein